MKVNTNGVKTHNDKALVSFDEFSTSTNRYFCYRPFDNRWIDYDLSKVIKHRYSVMKNMLLSNISLILCRQIILPSYQHVFVSSYLSDINSVSLQTKESSYVFPLYLYPDDNQPVIDGNERVPNLNKEIWDKNEAPCCSGAGNIRQPVESFFCLGRHTEDFVSLQVVYTEKTDRHEYRHFARNAMGRRRKRESGGRSHTGV